MPSPKPPHFYEPWSTTRSKISGTRPFSNGIPAEADQEAIRQQLAAWDRAEDTATWVVWGSGMGEVLPCVNLDGTTAVIDDRRIIVSVGHVPVPKGGPNPRAFAERMVACVNACAGMSRPGETIAEVRSLLLAMLRGEADSHDSRVLSLLSQMIPPHELEAYQDADD